MKRRDTRLHGVCVLIPDIFSDTRGYFYETYHTQKYRDLGIVDTFVQDNESLSIQGTLRGLHAQAPPQAQAKLVRAIQGLVFDVAVDIRPQSPTYGQWVGEYLSDSNKHLLYIPEGFAHGFYVLSQTAILTYKCSAPYTPHLENSIRWNDPTLNIEWPILKKIPLHLSPKDAQAGLLKP